MTTANILTRERLDADLAANPEGFYIDHFYATRPVRLDYRCFADLDGAHAAKWLATLGYTVTEQGDTGTHGRAITACGVYLSTNGWIHGRR